MQLTQQVNNLKDRFRSNPNLLQRRYQMSKDLIDLIALQQLKAEKEQAVKQINMSMQMNPATIKQQREREVMGLTQNQVAQGVGNALRQKQARQQRNLQRVAQTGIASRPTRNMQGLAEGGIVGFASGEFVDPRSSEIERIMALDIPKAEKQRLLMEMDLDNDNFSAALKKINEDDEFKKTGVLSPDMIPRLDTSQLPKGADKLSSKNYNIDRSANPYTTQLKTGLASLATDPKQASADRYDESMSRIDYTPTEAKTISDLNMERKALEDKFLDPEVLRQNRLQKGLIGMAGKSTLGLTGAGYAAGSMNEALAQQKAESELFKERDKAFKDVIAKSQDIREAGDAQAGAAASDAAADRRTSVNALAKMAAQFDSSADAEMNRLLEIDIANASREDAKRAETLKILLSGIDNETARLIGNQTVIYQMEANRVKDEANQVAALDSKLRIFTAGIGDLQIKKATILDGLYQAQQNAIDNLGTRTQDPDERKVLERNVIETFSGKIKAATKALDSEIAELKSMRDTLLGRGTASQTKGKRKPVPPKVGTSASGFTLRGSKPASATGP